MSNNLHTQHLEETIDRLEADAQALREEVAALRKSEIVGSYTIKHMAIDITAVGEALGISSEDQEGGTGEFIEAIQELQEELAALRARVVVVPSVDSVMNIVMRYQWNEKTNVTGTTNWAANLGMKVVDEIKRLNGKAVSEGLLRRILERLRKAQIFDLSSELSTLLGEGKEHE